MSEGIIINFVDLLTGKLKMAGEYYCHYCHKIQSCLKDKDNKIFCDNCGRYLGFKGVNFN